MLRTGYLLIVFSVLFPLLALIIKCVIILSYTYTQLTMLQHISLNHKVQTALLKKKISMCIGILLAIVIALFVLFRASVVSSVNRAGAEGVSSVSTVNRRLTERLGLKGVDLTIALNERSALLTQSLHVRFLDEKGVLRFERDLVLSDLPSWIVFEPSKDGVMHAVVSTKRIVEFLSTMENVGFSNPESCSVLSTYEDAQKVIRAQTSCIAKSGLSIDASASADIIVQAFSDGITSVDVQVLTVSPVITDPALESAGTMQLLTSGHSAFKGSGAGRKANVRKALNERLNNIIVPAGETFSFNSSLGGAVSVSKGWFMALTIFDGGTLRPAPGGGICQASTTLFRAALRAGFPIVAQKNHSLYVTYYEANGVGLDATVFPGQQDLKFTNDTGGRILIQSYTEGDEAYVNIYGTPDERRVTMKGPFFSSSTPESLKASGQVIRSNEVVWTRTVQTPVGTTDSVIKSRYKAIPRSLPKRFTSTSEVTMAGSLPVHASAGGDVAVEW